MVLVNRKGMMIPGFCLDAVDSIAAGDTPANGPFVTAILEGNLP